MRKRKETDGIVAMERGETVLVAQDGIFPEGLVFEVQIGGLPSGFEPTKEQMAAAYHDSRRNGYIVGAEDVLTDMIKRTVDTHEDLVREGYQDLRNDPSLDEVDFGFLKMVAAYAATNDEVGRR